MKNLVCCISLALLAAGGASAQNYIGDARSFNPLGLWELAANGPQAGTTVPSVTDFGTHGNNLSINGSLSATGSLAPPIGTGSVNFTDPAQYFSIPGANAGAFNFTPTQKFTVMAWVKTTTQAIGSPAIVAKYETNAGTGWAVGIDNGDIVPASQPAGKVFFGFVAGNSTLMVESTFNVNDGAWHFVACSSDGTGQASGLHIYIDGRAATLTTVGSSLSGTTTNTAPVTIGNTTDGSSLFEGSIAGVAVYNTELTPQQIQQLGEDAGTARSILSQFAFGSGWYSAVYFTNIGSDAVTFTVNFIADNGNPLMIPSLGAASTVVTLQPGASTIIEGISSGNLQQGYVSTYLPPLVTGYGLFRQSVAGIADQEAVVPLSGQGAGNLWFAYDETNGLVTAVAIVNTAPTAATVTVSVTDNNGNVIGSSTLPAIPPGNKIENVLNAYVKAITGTRGTVHFSVTGGGISAIGIRFNGAAFSSIPAQNGLELKSYVGVL